MIRCLDAHGLPVEVYAVEVDGKCYAPEEVAAIIAAAVALRAVDDIGHQCEAEDALFAALGEER